MKHYDFIIAGGGAAGLSLAMRLAGSLLPDASILIVDKDAKDRDDRTWGFWTDQPTMFEAIAQRSWEQVQICGEDFNGGPFTRRARLQNYHYQVVRGIDFYRFAHQELSKHPNVAFRQGSVRRIEDGEEQAHVVVDGQTYSAEWVFDSIFRPGSFPKDAARFHHLKLLFKGWEIETPEAAFDPHTVTLLDFRTPQRGDARFFYVLPYTPHRALVEYTLFTAASPGRGEYEAALQAYVHGMLGIQDFDIKKEESGGLPVTDLAFPRRVGRRIMTIGNKGGRIKPTTGYAFTRIQRDSDAIIESLFKHGHPFDVPEDAQLFRVMDAILLEIMQQHGDQIRPIFTTLFKNNPIERILRFLDEEASLGEVGALIASLPPGLFLKTLAKSVKIRSMIWRALGGRMGLEDWKAGILRHGSVQGLEDWNPSASSGQGLEVRAKS
ncbi:MAG TPA: lycopene cyclase family protein [Anaerolineales bacterium]